MVHDQLTPSLKHPAFEEQGGKAYFTKRELVHKSHVRERTLKSAVALLLVMFLWPCIDIRPDHEHCYNPTWKEPRLWSGAMTAVS